MKLLSFTFLFVFTLLFYSCNSRQSMIDNVTSQIERASSNLDEFSEEDWKELEIDMKELTEDLADNRESYNKDQRREVGRLVGKYTKLQIKKGVKDVIDFGTGIKDIIDGFTK